MFQSLDVDQRAFAERTFCSWERGWRSLLLRRFIGCAEIDDARLPPVGEYAVVLVTKGGCHIESSSGGRWRAARYVPGVVAMTAPELPVRLRWRPVSRDQPEPTHETLQLHLPAATTSRVVEELWDRDPSRVTLPDTLATTDPVLEQVMLDLVRAAEAGVPDLYAESAAEFVAAHLLVRHGAPPPTSAFGGDDERIRRAQAFLRANLHRPLSLAEIAAEAGLSRYHFLRVFRRQTGETPHRHLTRLRIERGQGELKRGSASVTEIAMGCGFASPAHFATAFRRHTGYAPSAYRRWHRRPAG